MTPSNVNTSALRTLHRIHRQVSDLKARQRRGPSQVRAVESHVEHEEKQLAIATEALKKMRSDANGKQKQLEEGEKKIENLQEKLNAAGSNREYQALKAQIAGQKLTNSMLDEEILEAWEKLEQAELKIVEANDGIEKAKKRLQAVAADVEKQGPLIRDDLARLEAELAQAEVVLPGELKEKYNRVLEHLGEDALAAVEDFCCSGCHQQVPINLVAEIKLGHPMFCRSCNRLLYIQEGD